MLSDKQRESLLAKARAHMSNSALGMQKYLDPIDVAGVLMGAGCGVLLNAFGKEETVKYLLGLAADLDADAHADNYPTNPN
jgi:hypothetical protein